MVAKDDIASADASGNLLDMRSRESHVVRNSELYGVCRDLESGVGIQLTDSKRRVLAYANRTV